MSGNGERTNNQWNVILGNIPATATSHHDLSSSIQTRGRVEISTGFSQPGLETEDEDYTYQHSPSSAAACGPSLVADPFSGLLMHRRLDYISLRASHAGNCCCRPFQGSNYGELSRAVLHRAFHLPHPTPEAAAVDAVLQRCLAKEARDLIESAAALQRELIPALRACYSI